MTIAESTRRHCHDSPVDACRDVFERRAREVAFHHEHQRPHTDDQNDHKEEEDANLRGTDDDGTHQEVALLEEAEEFEDAEDAYESERTHHHEVAHRPKQPADVERQCAQQVHDAEEAEGILFGFVRAVEAAQVFEREEEREDVFQDGEYLLGHRRETSHALDHDKQDARHDAPEQGDVEGLSEGRVALEDDDSQLLSECLIPHGFLPQTSDEVHLSEGSECSKCSEYSEMGLLRVFRIIGALRVF